MSKEQASLLGELMMLKAHHPTFQSKIGFVDGKVFFEAESVKQPFAVKDDEVHMEPAEVDYEAIGRDVVKLIGFNVFDPRKHLGDTFDETVKSWRDDIASGAAEQSDNLKVDVESLKVEGALTPDDVAQAYLETIGDTAEPLSDIVISIGTLNVN
ncbi:hypothetical protein [Ochrobactrum chromiisoli]|uniref:Uncharacterized protein n=1 Tax=Ochrobactrum chromiisoli TaxID=2993941 RepID=A0ABT3QR70_9HYPH|nr:hypothetical protein [Ochrobactrum chromiisoli]MCX2698109.1 hypothetical protein [Ochrobactrum chromiisoli]